MKQVPISVYQEIHGMMYFARMLDKMRKFAAGELREDFHEHLSIGLDGICCDFLHVDYETLKARVLAGGTDEEHLQWCYDTGHALSKKDLFVWNSLVTKIGWRDRATESLNKRKAESGLQDRDDIVTMAEYMEVDEGRKA